MEFERLGPYRIGRRLGRGGMGTVFEAESIETGQPAAVKVLATSLAHEQGFRDRFEAEINTLRLLRHPNIVRIYGEGEQEGVLFYAMELVEGTSLEEQLQAHRRFHWKEILRIGIKVAHALRHAHDRGITHRDIKPANLLLSRAGEIKLSDFGIAKLFGNTGMTAGGGIIGTAEYMAPEQADGRPVTPRCDLYSLGCVLYALCAGRPPFRARSVPEMLQLQRFAEPEPLRGYAPHIPGELEQLIAELLVKEPEARVPTALVLARRLEAMEHGLLRRERDTASGDQADRTASGQFDRTEEAELEFAVGPPGNASSVEEASSEFDYNPPDVDQSDPTRLAQSPHAADTLAADAPPQPQVDERTVELVVPSAMAAVSAPAPTAAPALAPSQERPSGTTRFTTVEDIEAHAPSRPTPRVAWPQIAGLAAGLVVLAAGAWYLLKPPSADALYQRISAAAADDDPQRLADVEPAIDTFLRQYPTDPRVAELRRFREENELGKLQRRMRRQARSGIDAEASPIERACAEAIRLAESDPRHAVKMLRALLDIYSGDEQLSATGKKCLELARRQLARLDARVTESLAADRAELQRQLARAQALRKTEPAKAAAIWRGIIELYGPHDWASQAVSQAREGLSQLANTAGT